MFDAINQIPRSSIDATRAEAEVDRSDKFFIGGLVLLLSMAVVGAVALLGFNFGRLDPMVVKSWIHIGG